MKYLYNLKNVLQKQLMGSVPQMFDVLSGDQTVQMGGV